MLDELIKSFTTMAVAHLKCNDDDCQLQVVFDEGLVTLLALKERMQSIKDAMGGHKNYWP